MSTEAVMWVLSVQGLNAPQFQLLIRAAERHDFDTGKCIAERGYLADKMAISPRSVTRIISSLDDGSAIQIKTTKTGYKFYFPKTKRIKPKEITAESPEFVEFWQAYPKRRDKVSAVKAWNKIAPDFATQKRIIDQVKVRYRDTDMQYIPLPSTYLNKRLFEDELNDGRMANRPKWTI